MILKAKQNSEKKICFITESPISSNDGASLRLYYEYINYFIKKKYDVLYIYFSKKGNDKIVWSNKKPKNLKIVKLDHFDHLLPNKFTLINKLDQKIKIDSAVNKFKTNVIVAFDIISISQIINCDCKMKIGWLGDLKFETNFYNFLYSVKENFFNSRHIFYNFFQNYYLRKKYKYYLTKLDKLVVSSYSSIKLLNKLGLSSKFLPYPWPKIFKVQSKKKIHANYLFFGNLSGLGSRSALNILFYSIYPKLKKKLCRTDFKIYICGKNFDKSFINKLNFSNYPEIEYLGFVENLNNLIKKCIAVIFPGNVPVGNRCRLISCMASKILIIAHKSCSLGNPLLIDGSTALLAKNSNEFVDMMDYAHKENQICEKIRNNAKIAYDNNYKPRVAGKILEDFIYEKSS